MTPLDQISTGQERQIKKISGADDTIRFLNGLGIVENEMVSIISETNGNLIIKVKGSRVAVDKKIAGLILV